MHPNRLGLRITNLFTIESVISSMAVKTETKNKEDSFLDGMIKAKEDNPRFFKKLEKI